MSLTNVKRMSASALACFVTRRLAELDMKPIEFARLNNFDQGMLSKILSSVKTNLELETALRLAEGLQVPPAYLLLLLGKERSHELISRLYLTPGMSTRDAGGYEKLICQQSNS